MFDDAEQRGVRVKICGITNEADARAAIAFGADALGLNCHAGSKRFIDVRQNSDWIAALPAFIGKVAVLVNPSWDEAFAIARMPFVSALQLHGTETPEFCARLAARGVKFAKAVAVRGTALAEPLGQFATRTVVLDSAFGGAFGGTGETFPWSVAREAVDSHPRLRIILAGGLRPENVAEAVRVVRPFAVDVTSGVEASPGRKDHERLRAFIKAAHAA
jgi:phosphoribosylanthranilate isomerase